MSATGRNLLDGKKRQASVLGSTLTSLTLNSENDTTTSSEEESPTEESGSSCEEDIKDNDESDEKSEEENDAKSSGRCSENNAPNVAASARAKKEQAEKEKPKVRMKTLTIDGQLVYFCVLCDKIFTRKKDKINHELAHNNKTLISCPECGKDFSSESSLAHHIRSHDGEQLHFCDFCPKMFAQSHQLKAHVLTHSKANENVCKICSVDFKSTSDLHIHNRNKIKEEMTALWCKLCNLFCCRIHCRDWNLNRLHAFRCSACNELFYTLKKLKLHAKRYAHKFNLANKITKTMVSDTDSEPLRGKSFLAGKRRIETNGLDAGSSHKRLCSVNLLDTKDPSVREQSVESKSETDDSPQVKSDLGFSRKFCKSQRKPYCKKCNRSFKESSDLISHKLSVHSSMHGLMCRDCGEDFNSSTDLKRHTCKIKLLKSHSVNNAGRDMKETDDAVDNSLSEVFECHICAKAFPFHDQLQNHIRLHTNIKSFQCYLCQRNFVNKHYLQRHLQVHLQNGSVDKSSHNGIKHESVTNHSGSGRDDFQSDDNLTGVTVNNNNDMVIKSSLQLGLDKENIYNFSDDSASSFLARESDKSDTYQLSSASSQSFKILMARERRKLRKKRNLSKSVFYKNMYKKRMQCHKAPSSEHPVVFVDKLQDNEDTVNNFIVEINGARSEVNQETTIFVELTLAKLVSKDTSVLCSSNGIDKENKIPPCNLNDKIYNTHLHDKKLFDTTRIHNSEIISNHVSSSKVLVLDLEVQDFSEETFSSIFDEKPENSAATHNLKSPQLIPSCSPCVTGMPWQRNHDNAKCKQTFTPGNRYLNDTASLQPLHSLHLMTAKFTDKSDDTFSGSEHVGKPQLQNMCCTPQKVDFGWPTSGKTCRDIAASWKSNRISSNDSKDPMHMKTSFKKANLSKENVDRFQIHPVKENVFSYTHASEKQLVHELSYPAHKSISSKIKTEISISSSSLPLSTGNSSSAFKSRIESGQILPSSICESSRALSSFSTPHSLPWVKREHAHGQDNRTQSSSYHRSHSSSSVITSVPSNCSNDETKCNVPGSFPTPGIINPMPTTNSLQLNKMFHFDTDNPALRDMNLMEMVCSIQTHTAATATVTQPEHRHHQLVVSSSNTVAVPGIKQEHMECEPLPTLPLSGNVKMELTHPSLHMDSHSVSSNFIIPSGGVGLQNPLPQPNLSLNPSMDEINPGLNHFHTPVGMYPSNPNSFGPPFQQPNWSLQMQTPFPSHGPNLLNSAFPLVQIPAGNNIMNDLNLNRCTYNSGLDNLVLGHSSQFCPPTPLVPNPISDLPSLHFGHPAAPPPPPPLFHAGIAPLPNFLPHPAMAPPVMLPNNGIFYLPF